MTSTLDESTASKSAGRQKPDGGEVDIRRYISGLGSGLAGPANVIMQLSWPAVGYGVKESRVHSGSAMKHPLKRARTTFTYLAVALLGDDEDRKAYRQAVNHQHAQVRSTVDSPVQYSALDPRLQLWVAACLYYGTVDLNERMHGPLDEATADRLYEYCSRFGTSLQVRDAMWPADRAAFGRYWEKSLGEVRIDDTIRDYLLSLTRLENLPWVAQKLFAENNMFWTRGFLPPVFREKMGLSWSDAEQQRFDRRLRRLGWVEDHLPMAMRLFPFNLLLWDMRRRRRAGRPLV
ncbi:oxygenase MpaB family protein [Acidiferrimicrobium sp. IK]|uniref:oxygenase MpaB family protein n=1 Tax=Acidiferrimicrobium sp. IK TaxID=2871700 RepID=UPI0021CB3335|nr:oxygenase MpaB family protein [Acidiferrimicrobium sp. IK]MCU4185375.1 oxygenase MpaB family protein [Acidiferrimicrobium sp. IK]